MVTLKVGGRLSSAVCGGQVLVIKSNLESGDLRCGGAPMLAPGEVVEQTAANWDRAEGLLVGKRYSDASDRLELLCVKEGKGALTLDGELLRTKQAKKLPSSD